METSRDATTQNTTSQDTGSQDTSGRNGTARNSASASTVSHSPVTPTIRLHAADDVVIARHQLISGARIEEEGVTASGLIPAGHKMAVRRIASGQPVRRYNQIIGVSTRDIEPGQHVHTHNLASTRGRGDLEASPPPRLAEPDERNGERNGSERNGAVKS